MSYQHSAALASLLLATGGCGSVHPPASPGRPPEPQPQAAARLTAAPDGTGSSGCETGGDHDIVQARLSLHVGAATAGSWIDIETRGPRGDALRACRVLVEAERRLEHRTEEQLRVVVERDCSTEGLAAAPISEPFVLVDLRRSTGPVALWLGAPADLRSGCNLPALEDVSSTVRRLTAYGSRPHCERMLHLLEGDRLRGREAARQQAQSWLTKQLAAQQERAAAACTEAAREDCHRQSQLLELLRAKQEQLAAEKPQPDDSSTLLCRPWP